MPNSLFSTGEKKIRKIKMKCRILLLTDLMRSGSRHRVVDAHSSLSTAFISKCNKSRTHTVFLRVWLVFYSSSRRRVWGQSSQLKVWSFRHWHRSLWLYLSQPAVADGRTSTIKKNKTKKDKTIQQYYLDFGAREFATQGFSIMYCTPHKSPATVHVYSITKSIALPGYSFI